MVITALALASVPVYATDVEPVPHPNHYVLLIDASWSTIARIRAVVYQRAVATTLARLYVDGFGVMPPYDPAQDFLTIEHFGCVPGLEARPYDRLDRVDFLRDFIHPIIARQQNVPLERAHQLAMSSVHYQLTLLSWSRPLGVLAIKSTTADAAPANRTFLIRISDDIVNNATLSEEQSLIDTKADPNHRAAARAAIDKLEQNYTFGSRSGADQPLSVTSFGQRHDHQDSVTVHVWEVSSRATTTWAAKASQVKSFVIGAVTWGSRDGDKVPGTLTLHPTSDVETLILANGTSATVTELRPDAAPQSLSAEHAANLAVAVVHCSPASVPVLFAANSHFVDPLLGAITYSVTSNADIPLPVPPICGLWVLILEIVLLTLAALAVAAVIWYFIFTRVRTGVVVRRLAGLQSWRLRWDVPTIVEDVVLPREFEVLRVELPTGLHRLLYGDARLVIVSDPPDEFQWNDTDQQSIAVSGAGTYVDVRRRKGKSRAIGIRIELRRKNRAAVFVRALRKGVQR